MQALSTISLLRWCLLLLATTLLSACASAPLYTPSAATIGATPAQVAHTPENYGNADVVWGGRIIKVENLADHTEVEILAFPLDAAQVPQANDIGNGRFIAWLPGYVERASYPAGELVTLTGHIKGVRNGHVGDAAYIFPLVTTRDAHVWPQQPPRDRRSNVHFGIGVGIGIH